MSGLRTYADGDSVDLQVADLATWTGPWSTSTRHRDHQEVQDHGGAGLDRGSIHRTGCDLRLLLRLRHRVYRYNWNRLLTTPDVTWLRPPSVRGG